MTSTYLVFVELDGWREIVVVFLTVSRLRGVTTRGASDDESLSSIPADRRASLPASHTHEG